MINSLDLPQSEFKLSQALLYVCKKSLGERENKPQIDYLLLDQQIEELQELQSRTCQQIVEFVDEYREDFIQINANFRKIENQIKSTESILKNTLPKIDQYKIKHFSSDNGLQHSAAVYEEHIIQKKLVECAEEESEFLLEFVHEFDLLINCNVEQLTHQNKYYIVRLFKKSQYLRNLFEHPMIKVVTQDYLGILNLLDNIYEEVDFYLSEQLSRVILSQQLRNSLIDQGETGSRMPLLSEIQLWYQYSNKTEQFYQTIEETLIKQELPSLESNLLSAKQSLINGREEQTLHGFFRNLFQLVNQFPENYPQNRIITIVYKFLSKKQLSFLYSYVVPTFPISFTAYKQSLTILKNSTVKQRLSEKHHWKLELWAELRIKSIMDRSAKDPQNDLNKWLSIVFKKSFMIHGVKNYMVKLAMMLINRYCSQMEDDQGEEFTCAKINRYVEQLSIISQTLRLKIRQGFEQQLNSESTDEVELEILNEHLESVIASIQGSLNQSVREWVAKHLKMVINSCKNSLESYKLFIMKVVNSKEKQEESVINKRENILRPLRGYVKNNPQLSEDSAGFIERVAEGQISKHYDAEYANDIYTHSKNNLTVDQMKQVMEFLAEERKHLFISSAENQQQERQ